MPPPPGAFIVRPNNNRFPLGPPPGMGNMPFPPPDRFMGPMDNNNVRHRPPLNPAMYQHPPPQGGFPPRPPPQQVSTDRNGISTHFLLS